MFGNNLSKSTNSLKKEVRENVKYKMKKTASQIAEVINYKVILQTAIKEQLKP